MKPLHWLEKYRFLDPNDPEDRATMPLLMHMVEEDEFVEADSPTALCAALIGNEYFGTRDEVTKILLRARYARELAAALAGLYGVRVLVQGTTKVIYDSANPPYLEAGEKEELDKIPWQNYDAPEVLFVEHEKAFLYSLHKIGVITLYERKDSHIFLPHPAQEEALKDGLAGYRCKNCLYFDREEQGGFCHQWREKVGEEEGYRSQCFVPRTEGFKGWFDKEAKGDDYLVIDGPEGKQKPWIPPWMMLTLEQELEQGWITKEAYEKIKAGASRADEKGGMA